MTDIQALLARPKNFRVSTHYADGRVKNHDVHSFGQAQNWAAGERRRVGRDLVDRVTGKVSRVVDVAIEPI